MIIPFKDENLDIAFKVDDVYKDYEVFFKTITSLYNIKDTKKLRLELQNFISSIDINNVDTKELTDQYWKILENNCIREP